MDQPAGRACIRQPSPQRELSHKKPTTREINDFKKSFGIFSLSSGSAVLPSLPCRPTANLSTPPRGLNPNRPSTAMSGEEAPLGALNLAEYAPAGARTVDCFKRIRKIGEGTYG